MKMKKLILAMMVSAAALMADGFVVGSELNAGKVDDTLSVSGYGYSDTSSKSSETFGITVKGGYQFSDLRVMATLATEKYNDDMVVDNEGNLDSYGVELDYYFDNVFVGATYAKGEKDFDTVDIDFDDVGLRLGFNTDISDNADIEAGVYFKKRDYDTYSEAGIDVNLDDKIIGLFVGVSFNL